MNESLLMVGSAFACSSLCAFAILWLVIRVIGGLRPATESGDVRNYVIGPTHLHPMATGSEAVGFDGWFARAVRDTGLPLGPLAASLLILSVGLIVAAGLFVAFENELLSASGAALGSLVTLFIGLGLGVRRRRKVVAQLPGWIDVLARSLRTGRSLEQALLASVQKLKGPLSAEFRRCADLLELGLSVDDAFRDLGSRYRSLDLQMVISAMSMNRQTGGDLPATLERLAIVARQRLESRRQAQAASSSARFAAICLAAAPPGILLYYLATSQFVTHLFSDPSGRFALALALALELVGIGWLLFLAQTED